MITGIVKTVGDGLIIAQSQRFRKERNKENPGNLRIRKEQNKAAEEILRLRFYKQEKLEVDFKIVVAGLEQFFHFFLRRLTGVGARAGVGNGVGCHVRQFFQEFFFVDDAGSPPSHRQGHSS